MAIEKAKKAKVKRPTALKRDLQNERNRIRNKAFRAQVSTAIKSATGATSDQIQAKLSDVYSLMDKGVKKGVFKKNKANRFKSRITRRLVKA
ncbi:MAG: 30S ribosomal protein S20 [Chlamydiota bacterium]